MAEPPPNKRMRRDSSIKESKIPSTHFNLEDNLENVQKHAILRQLHEFKREAIKYESEAKSKVEQTELREEQIGIALSEIQLIYDLVENLFDDLGCSRETQSFDPLDLLRDLLENKIDSVDFKRQLSEHRSSTTSLFNDLQDALVNIFETSSTLFKSLDTKDTPREIQELVHKQMALLKNFKEPSSIEHQLSSNENLKEKVVYLESSLRTEKASLLNKQTEIDELKEKLKSALKSVDRLQMANKNKSKDLSSIDETDMVNSTAEAKFSEELKNTFLKEIKELQEDKAKLIVELEFLKAQHGDPPIEHIRNSPAYKDILIQAGHFEHEYQEQAKVIDMLRAEVESLKTERSEVWERISHDEHVRWNTLSNQIKQALADLARVRKQRDSAASELKAIRNKEDSKHQERQELRKALSNQESLIKCCRSEVVRLRMKLAYVNKDLDAIKFIEANPEVTTMDDYFKKLAELEAQIKRQETELAEFRGQSIGNGVNGALMNMKVQLESYKQQLYIAEKTSPDDNRARIKELEAQCEFYSKSEAQLAKEIDQLGSAYSELTETQVNRVIDLGRKEDQISHLISEKTRLEKRLSALTKENEQSVNLISALKKQTTKLQDHIRKLDDQIKNLSFQMKTMERDFNSGCEIRSRIEDELKLACRTTQESKAQNNILVNSLAEVKDKLTESTSRLEEERFTQLQQRDELAALQSRLASLIEIKKNSHEKELTITLNQYKQLLQCTSCSLRFKSHALVKCMHVFCKQCIDDRLETRQRKCPSCNEAFGANDVKQIYL